MTAAIRVLYVDDEPSLLEIGKSFLEREGAFTVDLLTSAIGALEQIKTERYDAIVSDYQMPEMDGITFLKQLKASGNQTPFIIFTGRGREELVIEALNSGADFYLQKGGEPKSQFAELSHKIQTAVARKRTEKRAMDTERRLNDIINFLPDATFAIDTIGNVIAWNRAIEEMTGVPARDMLGKGKHEYAIPFYGERCPILIDLVSIPEKELSHGRYALIKKEGDILIAETTLPRPRGRYSVLLGKASLLYNDEGTVIGAIESIRDITEQKRGEEALRESGRQLNAMATNIPGVVYRYYVNPDGTTGFEYISERSRQILGLENDPATFFNRVTEGIVPKDRERFLSSVQHAIRTKTLWEFDGQYARPSGNTIWISALSSPLMENDRLIFDGVIFDNTERKLAEEELVKKNDELHASYEQIAAAEEELLANLDELTRQEKALRESEESFQSLVETAPDAIYISLGERFAYVNPAMIRLMGASSADQLLGMSLYDRIHPSLHEGIRERARIVISERKPVGLMETVYLKMDGTPVDIESAVATFRYQNNIAGLVILRDITRRKQVEQLLRENEEKYRTVFENTGTATVVIDENCIISLANEEFARLSGFSKDAIEGKKSWVEFVVKDDRERMLSQHQLRRQNKEDALTHYEFRFVTKSNDIRAIYLTIGVIPGTKKSIASLLDITDRKRAEEALNQANKKLTLLSGITRHDINNQLTVLRGYLTILENKQHDPTLTEYFGKAETTAQRISSMIQFTKEYECIGINAPVWQECRTLIDTAAKQTPLGKVMVKNDLPAGIEVFADPLIFKVCYNLMDNAVRYGGKITTIRFSYKECDGDYIVVCEDDGDGIPADEKERIFKSGFGKNAGLGLFLSKEILSLTGITITENGEPGVGARFEITVPEGKHRFPR
jgi:PAS domain S-box-containing protein